MADQLEGERRSYAQRETTLQQQQAAQVAQWERERAQLVAQMAAQEHAQQQALQAKDAQIEEYHQQVTDLKRQQAVRSPPPPPTQVYGVWF